MSIHRSTRTRSIARKALLGGAAAGMIVMGTVAPAMAANGSDNGSTVGHVAVNSDIVLTGLTSSFTLTGIPGATVSQDGAVHFTVTTNNQAGYGVTVQSETATMTPPGSNGDSIPIGALSVRETGTSAYTALSNTGTATVHSQVVRSAQAGDSLSNDYKVVIPFVNSDTYSATLDYVASTL